MVVRARPLHLTAFEDVVVDPAHLLLRREMVLAAAGSQTTMSASEPTAIAPLFGIDVQDAGDVGRGHRHELLLRQPPGVDAGCPQHRHAVLEPAGAVRDLREVACGPCRFCSVVKAQWSVATTCSEPDCSPAQSDCLMLLVAERRAHHAAGRIVPVLVAVLALVERQMLDQRLAVDALAVLARPLDRLVRLRGSEVCTT